MFVDRRWEMKVERINDNCTLGAGWQEFATEIELASGDTLVLFKSTSSDDNLVNVCIFKEEDKVVGLVECIILRINSLYQSEKYLILVMTINSDTMDCTKAFFKVISEDALEEGMLVC